MIEDKRIFWPLFILMLIAQLAVPFGMVYNKNKIADEGTMYKFELGAIDPNDPFRGKYIILNPKNNSFHASRSLPFSETMYATFKTDSLGFAEINTLNNKPPKNEHHLKVSIIGTTDTKAAQVIRVNYPFDRYYMNEHKALAAEKAIQSIRRDSSSVAYVEVKIKNGQHVTQAVKIDGIPIEHYLDQDH